MAPGASPVVASLDTDLSKSGRTIRGRAKAGGVTDTPLMAQHQVGETVSSAENLSGRSRWRILGVVNLCGARGRVGRRFRQANFLRPFLVGFVFGVVAVCPMCLRTRDKSLTVSANS